MESTENTKESIKQEFKYIVESQRVNKGMKIVGNLKSIKGTFTYPLYQCGDIVNYETSFNIVFCLLSDNVLLPPLLLTTIDETSSVNKSPALKVGDIYVSTTVDETGMISAIPVLKVEDINLTQSSFQYWLELVWQKRNMGNIPSLLVTSMDLPFGVTKFLRKYNTELVILPDIIAADVEPLDQAWTKKFISEVNKSYVVWGRKFNTVKLPVRAFCEMIDSAWNKWNTSADFDKLFLMDKNIAIAHNLEDQLTQQKNWMREPNLMTTGPEFVLQRLEVFRCSQCVRVFPIEEYERHAHKEVPAPGCNVVHKHRKLIGIARKAYFTCFLKHDNGVVICEICAKDFSKKCYAVHHILQHLQQLWCRACFKQLYMFQKHICLHKGSELPVFAQGKQERGAKEVTSVHKPLKKMLVPVETDFQCQGAKTRLTVPESQLKTSSSAPGPPVNSTSRWVFRNRAFIKRTGNKNVASLSKGTCEDQQEQSVHLSMCPSVLTKLLITQHQHVCKGNAEKSSADMVATLKKDISNLVLLDVFSETKNESDEYEKPLQSFFEPAISKMETLKTSWLCEYCNMEIGILTGVAHTCGDGMRKPANEVFLWFTGRKVTACEFCGKLLLSHREIVTHACVLEYVM